MFRVPSFRSQLVGPPAENYKFTLGKSKEYFGDVIATNALKILCNRCFELAKHEKNGGKR